VLLGFLSYDDRSADRGVVEKRLGHSRGQSDTTVGSGVGRDVTLMHRVAAAEKHRIRHARAIVMAALRSTILTRINVRLHDVAKIVHVIAEYRRDMVLVFRNDRVRAGRCPEPRFAGGDGGLADEMFAFIKIGVLLRDADDDLGRAGYAVAVPVSGRRRSRHGGGGGRHFGAADH